MAVRLLEASKKPATVRQRLVTLLAMQLGLLALTLGTAVLLIDADLLFPLLVLLGLCLLASAGLAFLLSSSRGLISVTRSPPPGLMPWR